MVILLEFIDIALLVYSILIVARALISWFRPDPYHPIVQFLHGVTEPVLAPIRNLMPQGIMLDFSPLIVIIIISVLRQLLRSL